MRRLAYAPYFGYLLSSALAIVAVAGFFGASSAVLAWCCLALAAILWLLVSRSLSAIRDLQQRVIDRKSQADLLQAHIEQQEADIDSLSDGLDVAIFICERSGAILYANQTAIEWFRFEDPRGRSILAVTLSYDLEKLILGWAENEGKRTAEIHFTYPDDRVGRAAAWTLSERGRVYLAIVDITDLKRLERIRQDFVANVSHELRTPLAIIRATAETLIEDPAEAKKRGQELLTRIVGEVDRLTLISNDLLILGAAESNPVRKNACNLASILRLTVAGLQPRAVDRGLELTYDGPEVAMAEANETQITQVAMNLVENAINYTLTGSVNVSLHRAEGDWVLQVADTGIGIASEHLGRIFERFYRVDKARSRSAGGTGLGLSIVKHIVEAHGGTLKVESRLNEGSVFTATIPVGQIEQISS